MATGRVNVGGGGGGLNVYCQLNEPRTKEGIWIKNNAKIKKIVQDNKLWFANEWNDPQMLHLADIPNTKLYIRNVAVNDKIYFFGLTDGGYDSRIGTMYIYNIKTNTWTQTSMPSTGVSWVPVVIGTDIYVAHNYYLSGQYISGLYKFDTITETWTQKKGSYYGSVLVPSTDGQYIYSLGTSQGIWKNRLNRYDVASDSWTDIGQLPHDMMDGATRAFMIGGYLYYFGRIYTNNSSLTRNYGKINPLTMEHTALGEAPFQISGSYPIRINDEIHFYTGNFKYVYSITNDTFTKVDDAIPMSQVLRDLTFYKGNVYIFGGLKYISGSNVVQTETRRLSFTSKQFDDGTVVLLRYNQHLGNLLTELISPSNRISGSVNRFVTGFDNVYMYIDNTLQEYLETYYGDGTKWVKFKGE